MKNLYRLTTEWQKRQMRLSCVRMLILALLIGSLIASCKSQLVPASSVQTATEMVRERVRDTTIVLPADKAMLQALLECDSTGRVLLKQIETYQAGKRIKPPQVTIVNNRLTATAEVDSASIYVAWKERDTTRTAETIIQLPPIEVNRLTAWQQLRIYLANILLYAAGAFFVYKFVRAYYLKTH